MNSTTAERVLACHPFADIGGLGLLSTQCRNQRTSGFPPIAALRWPLNSAFYTVEREYGMRSALFSLTLLVLAPACSPSGGNNKAEAREEQAGFPAPSYLRALPESLRSRVDEPYKGDLDGMVKRRLIRVAVPFNRTFYFVDKGVQRGFSYEYVKLFEEELDKKLNARGLTVDVVLLPLSRDMLLPALNDGRADMVVAQLTVTPDRRRTVDFSRPTRIGINEIAVSGPGTPVIASPEQLSGKHVLVRKSSSYYQSLQALNKRLAAKGLPAVAIDLAPETLEDDDLLEMVNAGLVPVTVADDYLAKFWRQVLPNLVVNERAPIRTGGELAVAIRKNSPQLASELNKFIERNGADSAFGRIIGERYLQSTKFVTNAESTENRARFETMIEFFRKYAAEYRFDYLLMAAQGYQESRLDQRIRSPVGAVGVMQVMPATGVEQKVGDIRQLEPNIHAGVKYMRFMMDQYFRDEPMDRLNKGLFTFASYNAGPGRIRQLRRDAKDVGLNPNVWFDNVEQIASARIGRETVNYVGNI